MGSLNGLHRSLGCSSGNIPYPLRELLVNFFHTYRFKLLGKTDSESIIMTKAYENGVLAMFGNSFIPSGRKTAYVRASFSVLSEEEIDEALRRLREALLTKGG